MTIEGRLEGIGCIAQYATIRNHRLGTILVTRPHFVEEAWPY
ncbi:hypothetical protein PAMC26577_16745 [Caballeronia sordidicola]|uniref:Uncharacterized protein n=1 Tax=Caballeronia sordidicola TaxID=196367 RepID=A0A242MRZ3_CABSO|nr:hypothetical protein PAMC26577_16745 [Caballeronia sordidicola]